MINSSISRSTAQRVIALQSLQQHKGTGDKFAVKLVKFDPEKKSNVLREVAWVKSTVKVIKDLYELGLGPSREALKNVPSVIKEGVSKKEANEIIAKIEAAGGIAVMEPME